MITEIVNHQAIGERGRRHLVEYVGGGQFDVQSAASGNVYRVSCFDGWTWGRCGCKWGQHHPEGMDLDKGCSHARAVKNWVAVALEAGAQIECEETF